VYFRQKVSRLWLNYISNGSQINLANKPPRDELEKWQESREDINLQPRQYREYLWQNQTLPGADMGDILITRVVEFREEKNLGSMRKPFDKM
jgi:hypothetical protein